MKTGGWMDTTSLSPLSKKSKSALFSWRPEFARIRSKCLYLWVFAIPLFNGLLLYVWSGIPETSQLCPEKYGRRGDGELGEIMPQGC